MRESREARRQIIREAFAEIVGFRFACEVGKRQHGNGRTIRQGQRGRFGPEGKRQAENEKREQCYASKGNTAHPLPVNRQRRGGSYGNLRCRPRAIQQVRYGQCEQVTTTWECSDDLTVILKCITHLTDALFERAVGHKEFRIPSGRDFRRDTAKPRNTSGVMRSVAGLCADNLRSNPA